MKTWEKQCKQCKQNFTVDCRNKEKKFCSHRCAAIKNNTLRVRDPGKLYWDDIKCQQCGGAAKKKWQGQVFCGTACKEAHLVDLWLGGKISGTVKRSYSSFVKRWLLNRSKNSCEQCGYNKTRPDGTTILQVDHIDGRWDNNTPNNLRLLCPNCHAMTPNWGGANKGNGREFRYK